MGRKNNRQGKKQQKQARRARRREPKARPGEMVDFTKKLLRWNPAIEGISGLAKRLGVSWHRAWRLASDRAGSRADAKLSWLRGRVESRDDATLVADLASRGVTLSAESLRLLAEELGSSDAVADRLWEGRDATGGNAHQQDLARGAIALLWERWLPDLPSDEQLADTLFIELPLVDGRELHRAALRAFWERLRPHGGLVRLAPLPAGALLYAHHLNEAALGCEQGEPDLLELCEEALATENLEAEVYEILLVACAELLRADDRAGEAFERLLAYAGQSASFHVFDTLVAWALDGALALEDEAKLRGALVHGIETADVHTRDELQDLLEYLDAAPEAVEQGDEAVHGDEAAPDEP